MQYPSTSDLPLHVFVDLDDTLFRTRRKVVGALGAVVSTTVDGKPSSYMSPVQRRLFDWLRGADHLVPTTARTVAALRRVSLPFASWSICSLGGVILTPDGEPDPVWSARVGEALAALPVSAPALAERIQRRCDDGVRVRVISDLGRDLYLSIRHAERDEAVLAALAARLSPPDGWTAWPSATEIVLRPAALGKAAAVRWLREARLGLDALAVGVGDRLSDAGFMAACDFAMAPTASPLFEGLGEHR